ncbi:MAG: type II secretion system inner membrane protein GspF [Desulfamplus sp.]|nr:type II secretion system inner membrane protein GspF [Desulfamplus sp.]
MTVFEYRALTSKGKKKTGIVDADSILSAGTKLRQQNIFPVSINEINSEISTNHARKTQSGSAVFSTRLSGYPNGTSNFYGGTSVVSKGILSLLRGSFVFSGISRSEVSVITRQLATLLSAGFPLVAAVATLVAQTESKSFQRVLSKIKESIEEGKSFSQALSQYPSVFSNIYINMIHSGESSGTLELVLERLADITEKQEETRKKIQTSLAYPVFMSITGIAVLVFLITYIVPGIIKIFSDMNQQLPAPTRLLISVSSFFQSFWWIVLLIPLIFCLFIYILRKTPKGLQITDTFLLSIPKAGKMIKKNSVARFSRILGSLLANGVPMLTALDISRNTTGNCIIKNKITKAAEIVKQGGDLGNALDGSREFPPLAIQMIKVGEKSGKLEQMLEKTAQLFEKETESSLAAMTALLEPLIILFMGAVVGFIVLSICLPIFEMNQLAR